jgi:hypothetical protein
MRSRFPAGMTTRKASAEDGLKAYSLFSEYSLFSTKGK